MDVSEALKEIHYRPHGQTTWCGLIRRLFKNNQEELVQSVACSTDVARITCRVCLKKIRTEVLAALSSEANTPGSRFFQNTVRS